MLGGIYEYAAFFVVVRLNECQTVTFVILVIPDIVMEFMMGRSVMKRTSIAVLILLVVGVSIGCNRDSGKDYVDAFGNKVFGEHTLKNARSGSKRTERIEYPDGVKLFDVTDIPFDDTKAARMELPTGEKRFEVTGLSSSEQKAARVELPNGEKRFEVTFLDDTVKAARIELPNGEKQFAVTIFPDGTKNLGRTTKSDGTEIKFSNLQNDQQGYADVKWGTMVTDLDPNAAGKADSCFFGSNRDDLQVNEAVSATFGTPTQDTVVAGTVLSNSLDFSLVPEKCKIVPKGDVRFIFYDDRLAMAFTYLNARNYEAIASEMASKFRQMDGWSVNWGGGAASDGDSTSLNVRLFQRGDTNTRIFLLKRTDHQGIGMNVSSVYLLYVPSLYYESVRQDISKLKNEKAAQQLAEQQKREQPDLQKIQ